LKFIVPGIGWLPVLFIFVTKCVPETQKTI
jgi:hypothetical protein